MPTDYRIPRAAVAGMNYSRLFWTVIEKAWPDLANPGMADKLHNCTAGQRALLAITLFIREVDNGGLEQFFCNTSDDLLPEVIRGFELLGASDKAMIINKAMAFFGISEPLPDRSMRGKLVKARSKAETEANIEPLNRQLYGEPKLWPLFRRYLDARPDEFFSEFAGR